jgi:hypothetical protein
VPNVTNIIAVAAGNNFNLALQEDGKVIAWPQRSYPIIIFPPYPFPTPLPIPGTNVPPGLSNVVAIAAGSLGMALNADGSVAPWATNLLPSGLTNAFAIAVGRGFFAALVGDGAPSFTIQPVSRTAGKGETVRFVSRAVGVQPVNYHWRFNGADIPGATNGTLVLTNVQGRDAGTYQVHALNSVGVATSIAARLTIPFNTNLAFALNATNLVWTTSPTHAPWFAQIQEAHDGDVAAQSGAITHGQQSILQTTVNGPGTLTFWWKVSSEEGYDFLKFQQHVSVPTFAPIPPVSISGETGWQSRTVVLFPSTNRLEWVYWKDNTVSVGRDAGWVDEVVLTPAPPSILLQPASQVAWRGSSVTFTASAICGGSPNYQWLKNGTDLPGRCTPSLTLTNLCRRDSGTYTLRVSNSSGTAISSNATLRVLVAQRLKEAVWQADGSLLLSSGDIDGNPLLPEDRPSFEFQASTNLVNWVPVLYPPWVSNGALWALDYDVYEIPTRFYRVVEH